MDKNISWRELLTIPNILTFVRLLMIPLMCYFIYHMQEHRYVGLVLFVLIWLTDFFDGYIARRFNQISEFGKLFDPAVDKIFQLASATSLYFTGRLPLWVLLLLYVKESVMVVGALILLKRKFVVSSSWPGKLSTCLWVLAFVVVFLIPDDALHMLNFVFLVPVCSSILAFFMYEKLYIQAFRDTKIES